MSSIDIEGGHELYGEVRIQGSKNATLPIMAASLLNGGISILKNYPDIEDVRQMKLLLESIGCRVDTDNDEMIIDSYGAKDIELQADLTGKLRASSVLLGPMLARFHHVKMAQPGGCKIGKRPLDIHMNVLKAFGATWTMNEHDIEVECVRLHPAQIRMSKKSVGATENAIMVASLIRGKSKITNAAVEPEIIALCDYLKATGVKICMNDNDTITVEGGECNHASIVLPGDRIVAGTFLGAVTACRGKIAISGVSMSDCRGFLPAFTGMGMKVEESDQQFCVVSMNQRPSAINCIQTEPFPGFPTDMQPIIMSCAAIADGNTKIVEKIFDHRFGCAAWLNEMGADVQLEKNYAKIKGVCQLKGSRLCAEDLRGAAALVIAGMSAKGTTHIENIDYLDRGYDRLCEILNRLGANIHGK